MLLCFERGDELFHIGSSGADVFKNLHFFQLFITRETRRILQLFLGHESPRSEVRIQIGGCLGDLFADLGTEDEIHESLGVIDIFRRLGNGQAVDEEVGAFAWNDPAELLVFIQQNSALTAPYHAQGDITIEKRCLGAVRVINFHQREPLLEDGLDFIEIFFRR